MWPRQQGSILPARCLPPLMPFLTLLPRPNNHAHPTAHPSVTRSGRRQLGSGPERRRPGAAADGRRRGGCRRSLRAVCPRRQVPLFLPPRHHGCARCRRRRAGRPCGGKGSKGSGKVWVGPRRSSASLGHVGRPATSSRRPSPAGLSDVTMAHIHLGNSTTNGPPLVILAPVGGMAGVSGAALRRWRTRRRMRPVRHALRVYTLRLPVRALALALG